MAVKYQLHRIDDAFTINMEAVTGVTYRSPISIDLIDTGVVSALYHERDFFSLHKCRLASSLKRGVWTSLERDV